MRDDDYEVPATRIEGTVRWLRNPRTTRTPEYVTVLAEELLLLWDLAGIRDYKSLSLFELRELMLYTPAEGQQELFDRHEYRISEEEYNERWWIT